ncbi:MAG: cytochrome b/b6 domain-containing protein [Arenicella sp.]|nr:cytochrome b/b6 domain-containing protein [Arenicella sp.]
MRKFTLVWDLPTRLFHWCLVFAVFYSWLSIEVLENMQHHFYSGYVVLTLLLFRLVWGFVGSHHSRFKSFIFSPSVLLSYSRNITAKSAKRYLGHNPLGGVSVIIMIGVLLAQAMLGLFSSDDYFFGPLSGLISAESIARISELHSLNSNAVLAIIGLHVLAIIYYKLIKSEPLTSAMLTGNKEIHESDTMPSSKIASRLLSLVVIILCVTLVYYLATAFLYMVPVSTESYY